MQTHQKAFFTRKEVARYLRISLPTVDRWKRKGDLKAFKAGGQTRFRIEDVEAFLKLSPNDQKQ